MKIFDKIAELFGYTEKKMPENNKPRKTDIEIDDEDYMGVQVSGWQNYLQKTVYLDGADKLRYNEIDTMDKDVPEISTALDVNADFIVYPNNQNKNRIFAIVSSKPAAQKKIDEINQRLSMHEQLFPMVRAALKYGDNVEQIVVNVPGNKVLGFRNVPIRTIAPVMEDGFPSQEPRIQQIINNDVVASMNDDEVFHLCLKTDRSRFSKFGKGMSMIEPSRLLHRQVRLMEEGMMISRLSRANQNYAMIIDVGELQGEEALAFLDKYKKRVMRRKYINPKTGEWSWEYNPLSVIEDIMVPTRAGSGGNVIPLNNNSNTGKNIEDIMYYQDKMIYSTGTPKVLIGKEIDINSKSTSEIQMSTFLRRIRRMQSIFSPDIKSLYVKMLRIEGVNVNANDIEIEWPLVSNIDEELKYTVEKLKVEIAKILSIDIGIVDDIYIYTKILGMTMDEAEDLKVRSEKQRIDRQERAMAMMPKSDDKDDDSDKGDDEKGDDEKGDEKAKTKEELIAIIKDKLTDEEYFEWIKINGIIAENPNVGNMIVDFINLTQAKFGE